MTDVAEWTWTPGRFLAASESGVFGADRVELIRRRVLHKMVIGFWQGATVPRLCGLLAAPGFLVSNASLPLQDSVPDPDVWVVREGAPGTGEGRVLTFDPADVRLVVEVADATVDLDLGAKAELYAAAGIADYWVVTPTQVWAHTRPANSRWGSIVVHERGETLTVPYTGHQLPIDTILGPPR